MKDPRAGTLRALLGVVEAAVPEVLLIENVDGIARRTGDSIPVAINVLARGLSRINRAEGTEYRLQTFRLDAADFGVPQHRQRLFSIAVRNGTRIAAPTAAHGHPSTGLAPFRTAWDALADIAVDEADPELAVRGKWANLLPTIPEGANYLFHTARGGGEPLFGWRTRYWSFLLKLAKARPAWTLQADPGSATGPFHWENRHLSVSEMAALQTFPADYQFAGSYRSARRQIGNAVPAALGEFLGWTLREHLVDRDPRPAMTLVPNGRGDCPPAERPQPVPKEYEAAIGRYPDHPGVGRGPGATPRPTTRA